MCGQLERGVKCGELGQEAMLEAGVQCDTPVQCFLLGIDAGDTRGGKPPPSGQSLSPTSGASQGSWY